jgi:hypothetical protein
LYRCAEEEVEEDDEAVDDGVGRPEMGLYKLNSVVTHSLKAPGCGFNAWYLKCDLLVSKICFHKCNLCRYAEGEEGEDGVGHSAGDSPKPTKPETTEPETTEPETTEPETKTETGAGAASTTSPSPSKPPDASATMDYDDLAHHEATFAKPKPKPTTPGGSKAAASNPLGSSTGGGSGASLTRWGCIS